MAFEKLRNCHHFASSCGWAWVCLCSGFWKLNSPMIDCASARNVGNISFTLNQPAAATASSSSSFPAFLHILSSCPRQSLATEFVYILFQFESNLIFLACAPEFLKRKWLRGWFLFRVLDGIRLFCGFGVRVPVFAGCLYILNFYWVILCVPCFGFELWLILCASCCVAVGPTVELLLI